MTSVVGVYLLSGSACLVRMWASVYTQVCLVADGGWTGNVIIAPKGLGAEFSQRHVGWGGKVFITNKLLNSKFPRDIKTKCLRKSWSLSWKSHTSGFFFLLLLSQVHPQINGNKRD